MMPIRRTNWIPGIFNDVMGSEWMDKRFSTSPSVNILETEDAFKVELAAPGVTKDDFKIEVNDDNHLVVSMERKSDKSEENKEVKYLRREFSYMNFRQMVYLPENVDQENIKAKMQDGVLTIDIPKKKEEDQLPKVKQIEIN